MKTDCVAECNAAAWLAGELSPDERMEFEQHLAGCAACQREVEATRRLVDRLQAAPAPGLKRDLAPGILARLQAESGNIVAFRSARWRRAAAAVAALLLPAAVIAYYIKRPDQGGPGVVAAGSLHVTRPVVAAGADTVDEDAAHVSRALDWFCVHQEIDGSWDPVKWGGNRRFKAALTGLPLIALLKGSTSPEHLAAAERAVACLRREQNEDGSFARSSGEGGYNHGIATLALLYACQAKPEAELKSAAAAALHFALSRQTAAGGWGDSLLPDVSVTLWYKEVLELAAHLGWEEAGPALAKTDRWLAAQASRSGTEKSPETRNMDYLKAYFAVTKLMREGTSEASAQLGVIRQQLVASQSVTGDHSGTWEPTGAAGRAGGLIYSTALASLALR